MKSNVFSYPFALCVHPGLGIESNLTSEFISQHALGQARVNCNLNLQTGNVVVRDKEITLHDMGTELKLSFTYNSLTREWLFSAAPKLSFNLLTLRNGIHITEPDGRVVFYAYDPIMDVFKDPSQSCGDLTVRFDQSQNSWVRINPLTGMREYFDNQGNLQKRVDNIGNQTTFSYSFGQLNMIVLPSGALVNYERAGNQVKLWYLENGVSQLLQHYELDDQNQLIYSHTGDGYQTRYEYQNGLLHAVRQTDGTQLAIDYQNDGKVEKIRLGDAEPGFIINYTENQTALADSTGATLTAVFALEQLRSIMQIGKNGIEKVQFDYDETRRLREITYPDQSKKTFEYANKLHLLSKITYPDQHSDELIYSDCATPVLAEKITHGNDGSTNKIIYVYDDQFKNEFKVIRFTISAAGRVTEHLIDSSSGLEIGIRKFPLAFYTDDDCSLASLVAWSKRYEAEYTHSNIIYKQFERNKNGRIEKIHEYRSVQANGDLLKSERSSIAQVINAFGLVNELRVQVDENTELMTTAIYNDNQLPLLKLKGENTLSPQKTEFEYRGQTTHTVYIDHVAVTISNSQGNPQSQSDISDGVERRQDFVYGLCGELQYIESASDKKVLVFYDKQHHIDLEISPKGVVVSTEHDATSRCDVKRAYSTIVPTEVIAQGASSVKEYLVSHQSIDDRISYCFYDTNLKIKFEIDPEGYIIEHRYDVNGHESMLIRYADKINDSELSVIKSGGDLKRELNRKSDRISQKFYDSDGFLVAEQDPAGYVTLFKLDAVGRPVAKQHYLEPLVFSPSSYADLQAAVSSAKHAMSYYFYNGKNECEMEIDQLGYITINSYFADGKLASVARYRDPISVELNKDFPIKPEINFKNQAQVTTYHYDELRRKSTVHYPNGKIEAWTYDQADNVASHTTYDAREPDNFDGDHFRQELYRYNGFGDVIAKINPFVAKMLQEIDQAELSPDEREQQISEIWKNHAEQTVVNQAGLRVSTTDPYGNVTKYLYDADKNLRFVIGPTGIVFEKRYNAFGEVILECHYAKLISEEQLIQISGGYLNAVIEHDLSALASEKDAVTRYKRDHRGIVIEKIDPEQFQSIYRHNAFAEVTDEYLSVNSKEPDLHIYHEYESRGLETMTIQTAENINKTTQYEYQHYLAKKTKTIDSVGNVETHQIDLLGRETGKSIIDEEGNQVQIAGVTYDAYHRPLSSTDANYQTSHYSYQDDLRQIYITKNGLMICKKTNVFDEMIEEKNHLGEIAKLKHSPDGQVISRIDPNSDETSTELNLVGKRVASTDQNGTRTELKYNRAWHVTSKIEDANGQKLTTHFKRNAFGLERETTNARGITSFNSHDRCGNLTLSVHDTDQAHSAGLRIHVGKKYNGQGIVHTIKQGGYDHENVFHAESLLEKIEHDALSREIAKVTDPNNLNLRHEFEYNAADQLVKSTNPDGEIELFYHNHLRQLRFTFNQLTESTGSLTEKQYSRSGKITFIRVINQPIRLADIEAADSLVKVKELGNNNSSPNDTCTQFIHDEHDRERFIVKYIYDHTKKLMRGIVTEKIYDAAHREIATIEYADLLRINDQSGITLKTIEEQIKLFKKHDQDRVSQYVHDKIGQKRLVAKDGILTFNRYSKTGKLLEQTHYETEIKLPTNITADELAEFEKLLANKASSIRRERFYYDALDRLVFTINPIGEVKRQDYDENGNTIRTATFHESIDTTLSYEESHLRIRELVPDREKANAAIVEYEFDHNDKQIKVTDALGYQDHYVRDDLGRLRQHIDRRGYVHSYEYDSANRLTDKISPETTVTLIDEVDGKLHAKKLRQSITDHTDFDHTSRPIRLTSAKGLPSERTVQTPHHASGKIAKTVIPNVMVDDPLLPGAMAVLPEKTENIENHSIYDVRGNLVAEKNQNGLWSFHIYDSLDRLIFVIDSEASIVKYSYNAFGERIKEHKYAKPLTLDITKYKMTGIPLAVMLENVKSSPKDRVRRIKRDKHGNEIEVTKDTIIYYENNKVGKSEPRMECKFNAFKQWIKKSEKIGEAWRHSYRWYDANGNLIAEVNSTNHLTLYRYNSHSKINLKVEFAEPLSRAVDETFAIADIVNNYVVKNSDSDRMYEYEYDARGGQIAEHECDVTTQKLIVDDSGIPSLVNIKHKRLTKQTVYSPTEKVLTETNEKGLSIHHLYDERDIEIAVTQLPRSEPDAPETLATPVTLKGIDPHGVVVATQQTVTNGSISSAAELEKMRETLFSQELPHLELLLTDNRGKVKCKQNALGELVKFTYMPGGKIARELSIIKIWVIVKKEYPCEFAHVEYLEEKRFTYSKFDRPVATAWYRAGKLFKIMQARYNVFNEITHDFLDDPKKGTIYKRDLNGHVWKLINSGATTLRLRNLLGEEVLTLQAPKDDLSTLAYADLMTILSWDAKRLERTESIRNLRGSVVAKKSPIWFKDAVGIPTHQYVLDRWDNPLKSINSLGHETDYVYNHKNHVIKSISPEVDDVGADGVTTRKRQVTLHGFDECQLEVGTTNSKGNTEGHVYDDAGQWVKHILGDGTVTTTRRLDALGMQEILISATGAITTRLFDLMRKPIKTIFPSGRFVAHRYDGQDNIACHEDPQGIYLRYNYDPFKNVWQRFLPNGEVISFGHDHNHLMTLSSDADAIQEWFRLYDGTLEKHLDLAKKLRIYENNFKNQPVRLYSVDVMGTDIYRHRIAQYYPGPHSSLSWPYAAMSVEPPRQLGQEFEYGYGLLDRVIDTGVGQTTDFTNDTEGTRVGIRITDIDGIPRHTIDVKLDELRRMQRITDRHYTNIATYATMSATFSYDGADNHRRSIFTLDVSCFFPNSVNIKTNDFWFDFNRADLVTVHAGSLSNGVIQPVLYQGVGFTYNKTLRATESLILPNQIITNTLGYDQDSQLVNAFSSTGMRQVWSKNAAGVFYQLDQSLGSDYTTSSIGYGVNRWLTSSNFTNHATGAVMDTSYANFRQSGHPQHQTVTYGPNDASHTHDEYDLTYTLTDKVLLWSIRGQRFSNGQAGPASQAQMLYNPNGIINGKSNSTDEHVGTTVYPHVAIDTTHDGIILSKHIARDVTRELYRNQNISYHFLNSPFGQFLGGYAMTYHPMQFLMFHAPQSHQGGPCSVNNFFTSFVPFFPTRMVGRVSMPNPNPDSDSLTWDGEPYFNLGFESYECKHGDTCIAIAQNRGLDVSFATALANENGITETQPLPSGFILIVPPHVNNYYKSTSNRSYNDFMNKVIGAIQPHLVTPLPPPARIHQGSRWFRIIVKVIAVAVVLIAAYYLGPWILKFMPGVLNFAAPYVAASIAGAVGSVIGQGIESAAGVSHFSTLSVLETAATAGFLQGMTAATTLSELALQAVEIASIEASLQLTEMAAGQRHHFDTKSILVQVAASLASLQAEKMIDNDLARNASNMPMNSVAKNLANSSIQLTLGSVTGAHPDYDQMAASLIGTGAGSTACSYLPPPTDVNTDINHRLQKAEQHNASAPPASHAPTSSNQTKGRPTLFGQMPNEQSTSSSTISSSSASYKRSKWEAYVESAERSVFNAVRAVQDVAGELTGDAVGAVMNLPHTLPVAGRLSADAFSVITGHDRSGISAARLQAVGHAITQATKDGISHFVDDISSFDSYRVSRGLTHLAVLAPGAGRAALEGLGALGKVRLFDRAVVGGVETFKNKATFTLATRVEQQLLDPRMGSLAGNLNAASLNELAGNLKAQLLYDVKTGNINVINNVNGKLLRITTPRDSFKIISVGPIQERNIINSITSGRFIPIGNQLEESADLASYMSRIRQ